MPTKPLWASKTVLLNAIIALAGILASLGVIPGVATWISSNSSLILGGLGIVGIALRLVTKGAVDLGE